MKIHSPFHSKRLMARPWLLTLTLMAVASVLLSACNFSITRQQPTIDNNAISTLVYQTAQAVQTQDAFKTVVAQLTQAPQITATSASQATSTSAAATATQAAATATQAAATSTPVPPTLTPAATKTNTPVPPTATATAKPKPADWVSFVSDVSVPDGTSLNPGANFTKTWRLKNIGTTTWTKDYALVYVTGESMGALKVINLTNSVAPGAQVDLSAAMVAPANLGSYEGDWMLRNAGGTLFGIGPDASKFFWVKIQVVKAATVAYDFTANFCASGVKWVTASSTVSLPCPGTPGSADGSVIKVANPVLETGVTDNEPSLKVEPAHVNNGVIQGTYPAYTVQNGDHFKTVIGCTANGTGCDIIFAVHAIVNGGTEYSLGSWEEKYDKLVRPIDIDLSSLAGKNVVIILKVFAKGAYNANNLGHWLYPRIVR